MIKKILFICKHNVFRSKVAEACFKKLNKNRDYIAKSAGLITIRTINPIQRKVCKWSGIIIKSPSRGISVELLKWADLIIIVANDVPPHLFSYDKRRETKSIVWRIPDVFNNKEQDIEKVVSSIRKKIKSLIKNLK